MVRPHSGRDNRGNLTPRAWRQRKPKNDGVGCRQSEDTVTEYRSILAGSKVAKIIAVILSGFIQSRGMRIAWRWNERKGEGERKSSRERSSNSGAKDRIAGTRVPCSDRLAGCCKTCGPVQLNLAHHPFCLIRWARYAQNWPGDRLWQHFYRKITP